MELNFPIILHGENKNYYIYDEDITELKYNHLKQIKKGYIDNNREKLVAVKISSNKIINKETIYSIYHQNEILESLESYYIVKFFDYFEYENYLFSVYEYCNDCSLKQYVDKKFGTISFAEAMIILEEITQGFIEINKKNIIHGNISSKKILIHNSLIKISGFFKVINENKKNFHIDNFQNNDFLNNSFEKLFNISYSNKCDIFSIGIVIYSIIFKINPFIFSFCSDSDINEDNITLDEYKDLLENNKNKDIKFPFFPWRIYKFCRITSKNACCWRKE